MSFLENIEHLQETNFGGAKSLDFILADDVRVFPHAYRNNIASDIVLWDNKSMYKMELTRETQGFRTDLKQKGGVDFFETKLGGIIPKDRILISTIIDSLQNNRLILIATDNNGNKRIIGSKKVPVNLRWKANHKTKFKGRNEYTIEFSHISKSPPYYYQGAVPGVHTNSANGPNGGHPLTGLTNFLGEHTAAVTAGKLPGLWQGCLKTDVIKSYVITEMTGDPGLERVEWSTDQQNWEQMNVGDQFLAGTTVFFRWIITGEVQKLNFHYVGEYN